TYLSIRNFRCGLSEPGFEASVAEPGGIVRHQCSKGHLRTGVTRFRVSDNLARIFQYGQSLPDQFVHAKLFRACDFDNAIYRRTYCDPGYATRDIVGSHRLEKYRWQTHLVAVEGNVGEAFEELEELRRMDDRVGNS